MREELKELKQDKRNCEHENENLHAELFAVRKTIAEYETGFSICQLSQHHNCPFLHQTQDQRNQGDPTS